MTSEHQPTNLNIEQENNTKQWQRVSPLAMLYFVVKILHHLISNIVYIAPAIIVGYKEIINNPWIWLPISALVTTAIGVITFLNYYFFQYRLTVDHIEIRSGVFSKTNINLPFTRIQNIKLEQPFYYRPFNYTCLQLDTAGSAKQEAKIVALKIDFAEQLKQEILAINQQQDTISLSNIPINNESVQLSPTSKNQEVVLNTRSLSDLVIHGLSNNRVWIFLGGLAPFFDEIGRSVVNFFKDLGIDIEQLLTFADKPWWQISLYALTLTFIIILPITIFSIAGSIISFYNFTLSKLDDRYIRRSGLLTKHEVTMKLSRLQMIVRQQDWLDMLLKRINLKFEQNSSGPGQYQAGNQHNKIIVPSITEVECDQLINDVYPEQKIRSIDYINISKRFILRNILYKLFPIYLGINTVFIINEQPNLVVWLSMFFILFSSLIFLRWYRWGYAIDEQFIYIRKGLFGLDYYCFPLFKVQQSKFKQSIFLKRRKLCSLSFVLACGAQSIPFIKEVDGYKIINNVLKNVEQSKRSWM